MKSAHRQIRFPKSRQWEYSDREGVTVSTYGIPQEFREAFLNILVVTRGYYRRLFGDHVIDFVEFNVRKSRGLPLRLWTNGADRVFLTLSRKTQLEPASVSGVRHLHGLTHELAHIVLYRSLINLSELAAGWGEGWAIYLGSFWGVPHLYEEFGDGAWPYPHCYLASDGPGRYQQYFSQKGWRPPNPTVQVVYDLYRWQQCVGDNTFVRFFQELLSSPLRADQFNQKVSKELRALRKRKAA